MDAYNDQNQAVLCGGVRRCGQPVLATLLVLGLALARPGISAEIIDPGQGAVELPRGRSGAFGLSGISHAGKDRYYAVSDQAGDLFALDIRIDRTTGEIIESSVGNKTRLASARDTEGVALAGPGSVWVCDEVGPNVRKHQIDDGTVLDSLEVPPVFAKARRNLSLEALSLDPTGALWFANEEALRVDGPKSTAESGSLVRLQRFERSQTERAAWVPAWQWAYQTDPVPGKPMGRFSRSGVVDLVAVPEGPLLVLERGFGSGGIRARIYSVDSVDGSEATDTSARPSLVEPGIVPVRKRLLWEGAALGDNFEGMTLGPELANGERSLILISDDGGATQPRLYALRFRLQSAAPAAEVSVPPPIPQSDPLPLAAGFAAALLLGVWALRARRRDTSRRVRNVK